jgi:shikimate kinase
MEARRPIYESIADSIIDVNEKSESEIVSLVLEVIG